MIRIALICLIIMVSFPIIGNSQTPAPGALPGNADGSIGSGDATGGNGQCTWDPFLEHLGCQETGFVCGGGACPKSCDKQYTVKSPRAHDPSWGKWQFTPSTWRQVTAVEYPQCQGMENAISVECRPAQRWATIQFMNKAIKWFQDRKWCDAKLGSTVSGCHQGTCKTCQITKSGLLSAYHNAGGNACSFAGGTSKWSSQINWRICDAGSIPFPEDCNPQEQQPTVPDKVTPETPIELPPGQGFEHPSHFNSMALSLKYIWVAAFQQMANQLTTTMMQQVQIIGSFFDAKHQLETQRLIQQKSAEAHKDYHPSEQMCEIGTFTRNLLESERRSDLTKTALSRAVLDRTLRTGDTKTFDTGVDDSTRNKAFVDKFCDTADNAKNNKDLCQGAIKPEQKNADINFTQTIDLPLTLDLNINDRDQKPTQDQENIFTFLDYIFTHETFPWLSANQTELVKFIQPYQEMRSLIAMRSVAQNSFANIIAQKTPSTDKEADDSSAPFIKALMRELGLEDKDIEETIGKNPSYFAQMEVLTKKLYQDPEFISNLYDKPANVKRLRAAMTAIKLMQDRDIHEAMMRREMLISMILELRLREQQTELMNSDIRRVLANPPGDPKKSE